MNFQSTKIGHVACFSAYAIFGLNIIVCKSLTSAHWMSPVALTCLRALVAAAVYWAVSLLLPREQVARRDLLKIFAASLIGFLLPQVLFMAAIEHITPMDCSIVSSTSPVCTMIIAAIALKEPITLRKAGGVTLSLAGILFLILSSVGMSSTDRSTNALGLLMMITNIICFSTYLGAFKPLIARYTPITFMKWVFLFSALISLPLSASEMINADYASLSSGVISELSFLIICCTIMTYYLIPVGQQRIRPTLVSMYSYVQPIIAIAVSICVGMDTLTLPKVIAAVTVFVGVVIVSYSRSASECSTHKKN